MTTKNEETIEKPAKLSVKDVHEAGSLTINGREYKILALTHQIRLKVFSYYSSVELQQYEGNYSYIDTDKYREVEKVILNNISCNGIVIGTKHDYFTGEAQGDYLTLMETMFDVFCHPLLTGSLTD